MRLVIIDGIDNAGKSAVIERVKFECPEVEKCAFPSNQLANSLEFQNVAKDPSPENRTAWYSALMQEEKDVLSSFQSNSTILVDRMWFSTLIYQGGGPTTLFEEERKINGLYNSLMKELGLYPEDVFHVILRYPVSTNTDKETNKAKRSFDKKRKSLFEKQENLIADLHKPKPLVWSPYFKNLHIFSEPDLKAAFEKGVQLGGDDLDDIQYSRSSFIIDEFIRS